MKSYVYVKHPGRILSALTCFLSYNNSTKLLWRHWLCIEIDKRRLFYIYTSLNSWKNFECPSCSSVMTIQFCCCKIGRFSIYKSGFKNNLLLIFIPWNFIKGYNIYVFEILKRVYITFSVYDVMTIQFSYCKAWWFSI